MSDAEKVVSAHRDVDVKVGDVFRMVIQGTGGDGDPMGYISGIKTYVHTQRPEEYGYGQTIDVKVADVHSEIHAIPEREVEDMGSGGSNE